MEMFEDTGEGKLKFDNFFLGLFGSFFMTLVCLYLAFKGAKSVDDLEATYKAIYESSDFVNLMIASLLPSMFLFFFFYKTERWQSGKGLIVAVLLSMVLVVLNV